MLFPSLKKWYMAQMWFRNVNCFWRCVLVSVVTAVQSNGCSYGNSVSGVHFWWLCWWWRDRGKPSGNCIDVVAGIPSKEQILFTKKEKEMWVKQCWSWKHSMWRWKTGKKTDFRMTKETGLTPSWKDQLLFLFTVQYRRLGSNNELNGAPVAHHCECY